MGRAAAGLALAVAFSTSAFAGTVTHFTSNEGREVVVLSGEIAPGDSDQIIGAIQTANAAGRSVSGLRLNSVGGNLVEGTKIADVVRYAKIATVVANGSTCASACFIALAAGKDKYVSYGATVGVHGASANGQETEGSRAATIAMAKIVKQLGVPPGIIGQMVVTPPNQIVWLQPEDLQSMGVRMTGKTTQVAEMPTLPQQTAPGGMPPGPGLATAGGLTASSGATDKNATWSQLVNATIAQATRDNPSASPLNRVCQPEYNICTMAVFGKGQNGKPMMVRVSQDANGKMIARHFCTFNEFSDIRECLDWDTGAITRDMKDAAGKWNGIPNQ